MNTGTIVKLSFVVMMVFAILGAMLKILHTSGADVLLMIGVVASAVFIVSAVYEVQSSRIDGKEKALWTIGLIFMSGIVGIIYLVIGRRRVIEKR